MKVYRIQHIESGLFHVGGPFDLGFLPSMYRNRQGHVYRDLGEVRHDCYGSVGGLPKTYRIVEYTLDEGREIEL